MERSEKKMAAVLLLLMMLVLSTGIFAGHTYQKESAESTVIYYESLSSAVGLF